MPRTRHLVGAITAALFFGSTAAAADFSRVVVFGDSLSDSGNISLATAPGIQPPLKFTTNPGKVTVEQVSSQLNLTLDPSLAGGSNYAWGGAGVLTNSPGTPGVVPTLTSQVNAYLAGGSIDRNALYSVWGGANDIFYHATAAGGSAAAQQLIAQTIAAQIAANNIPPEQVAAFTAQITPTVTAQVNAAVAAQIGVAALQSPEEAQANVAAAAQQEVKLIGQLQTAGAKNILVFNLPNIGSTPSAAGQGPAAAASLAGLSQIYNGQLNSGLGQMQLGIIPVNVYQLLSEAIANPSGFGFSNVTDPACGAGASSVQCGPQGAGLPYSYAPGTDQSYLFADGVHPTAAAHAMVGQYVMSMLEAPGQASLLAEAPLQASSVQNRVLRTQMLADSDGGQTRAFVNIDYGRQRLNSSSNSPRTNSHDVNVTLGTAIRVSEHVSAGIGLGVAQNSAYIAGGGGYRLQDISGLGYISYHRGGGYVGGYVNFGQSNFKNINRRVQLGAMQRSEMAKADGSHVGGGMTAGWWFNIDKVRTGPFITADWQTVKVGGYAETSGDSSAMWFGKQQRDALVGTLGWRLQGHFNAGNTVLSPYGEIAWNRDSKGDPRQVTAGLTSMNGAYALTGFVPDKSWGTLELGVTALLTPSVTSWVGYNGRFSDTSQRYSSFNMGVKILF